MRTEIIAAGVLVASAVFGVRYLDTTSPAPQTRNLASVTTPTPTNNRWAREVRIAASRDHQFYVNAEVNRRSAKFLVDTGASYVALRDTDAREAGIYTSHTDYNYPVRTANGETNAAFVTLDEVEINGIRVEGVKAFILPDNQLAVNLLGMSFLSRIESVEARAGELVLRG
jgi:aspartyl protease family protein